MFHIDIPDDLATAMQKAKTGKDLKQTGIEWCIAQSKELKKRE